MKMLLCLSFKGSLARWQKDGILTREMEVYLHGLRHGLIEHLFIYTYGRSDESELSALGVGPAIERRITLVAPRFAGRIGQVLHSINVIRMRGLARLGIDICKTNQINGGWAALAARLVGIPVLARCGYILSRRLAKNSQPVRAFAARLLERALFGTAALISVTTDSARRDIAALTGRDGPHLFVNPTYVDTDVFQADATAQRAENDLIFVGRLEPSKNVLAIIEACHLAGTGLQVVGSGSLKQAMEHRAAELGVRVLMHGPMQNNDIAVLFSANRFYILASLHEGLPKSLIEAMSAEMICIGTDVPGISDLIVDGRTGYLAQGVDAAAVAVAISRARAGGEEARSAARAAREHVLRHHSVDAYARKEIGMIADIAAAKNGKD